MLVLVINSGSSSLKYQLINVNSQQVLLKGNVEKIGTSSAFIKHYKGSQVFNNETIHQTVNFEKITNHQVAIDIVLHVLQDPKMGAIKDIAEISIVGHRVVHGGEKYASSVIINQTVLNELKEISELAPLHNPANIMGIEACQQILPQTPMVAVFDTAFHQTMSAEAYIYALPYEVYQKYKIRRYGFHGTSHKFVASEAAKILQRPLNQLKLISCHLGNGASICAIQNGASIDTSMGFTPLAGLTMGTRCGDIDPSIVPFLASKLDLNLTEIDNLMNKESGVLGISGISNDFRDIEHAIAKGNPRAKLAQAIFNYNVKKYIGAYAAAMNGVDAIIFTAGVGENSSSIRADILSGLSYLGLSFDEHQNQTGQTMLNNEDSKVKALIIPTNEELMIAIEANLLINN